MRRSRPTILSFVLLLLTGLTVVGCFGGTPPAAVLTPASASVAARTSPTPARDEDDMVSPEPTALVSPMPVTATPQPTGEAAIVAAALNPTATLAPSPGTAASPLLGPGVPPGPGDWPVYGHDPARTNYNPAETLITPENVGRLVERWRADIGFGSAPSSSGPSVTNGQVYVGSSATQGSNFYAIDAATGKTTWATDLGHANTCFGVGIGASPAISGSVVVAGGTDGAYYGLNSYNGNLLWRDALNAGPSGFAWASPLFGNDRVYVGISSGCDNPSVRGEVRAINPYTGSTLATVGFVPEGKAGAGIWNSPALAPDGKTLAVTTGEDFGGYNGPYNRAMVSMDALNLQIKQANQEGPTDNDKDFATSPIIFSDRFGRTLVAAHHKDEYFYAYDLNNLSGGPIWKLQTGSIIGMMPAYDSSFGEGGTLFVLDGVGKLHALDPATGNERSPSVHVGSARGNMAIADGMIFFNLGVQGLLVVSEKDGSVLTNRVPEGSGKSYSGIAVANGFVYWVSGRYLYAWSLPAQ